MNNRRVLIVGMARSGIAAAKLLAQLGAKVTVNDQKTLEEFGDSMDELRGLPVKFKMGEPAEGLLDQVDLLVISPGVPVDAPVVNEAKSRGIEVIGELELAARTSNAQLIAITGTNGKTTTTTLLGEIMKNAGKQTYVVGNIGYPFTEIALQARRDDVAVCEVSSFQLETVSEFHPHIAALLNITEDHMNRHFTMERYVELKARVFENQTAADFAVLNFDDERVRGLADSIAAKIIWFSRKGGPEYGAFVSDDQLVYGDREHFRAICALNEVALPGPHNLENAMAAVCMAMAAEIPPPVIRHTLRTFKGVEHRLEFVRELDGVRYINDSKGTNVDSTLKAIETMDRPTVMILGGYDKQVDMTPLCEALVGSAVTDVILIGQTAAKLEKGLDAVGFDRMEHAGYDFKLAVEMARERAKEGGNVLLSPACASFDMFEDYEFRGREFKRIVEQLESTGL